MSADRLDRLLAAGIAAGLLPADARIAPPDERPWPVVLLTALGAWLAALPLLGVVGLLLGDLVQRGAGPYLVGALVLSGAVVVLRSGQVALFVEQLAVPGLLVGVGTFGFGLFRDLPMQPAALLLTLLVLLIAALVRPPWLRVLLGVAACGGVALAVQGEPLGSGPDALVLRLWLGWQICLALWLLMLWLLRLGAPRWLLRCAAGREPAMSMLAALESISVGWVLATLLGLTWADGSSFLIDAGPGQPGRAVIDGVELAFGGWLRWGLPISSALCAVAAGAWIARCWPLLRQPWCGGVALTLAVLAWFMPTLGAVLLILAVCVTAQRWRLATAAALAAGWLVGAFYYALTWTLAQKAALLVGAAAWLAGLAWWGLRRAAWSSAMAAQAPAAARSPVARLGVAVSLLGVLLVVNVGIWQKEQLIRAGRPVFVELAPVDPRSLMQGDYMALNYRLGAELERQLELLSTLQRPHVMARLDERGVARLERLAGADAAGAGELLIELTPKNGRWVLVSDAWFFREGEAERWQAARYGEFRVDDTGRALLVGLADEHLRPLGR